MKQLETEHLALLSSLGEDLAGLAGTTDVPSFLQRTVERLSKHLDTGVCSIYLYEEATAELVLTATAGLNRDCIGRVRLAFGEGLVGKAMKELRYICVEQASAHPDYRYFADAGEEPFECFLAVPIQRGVERIGVLVIQREQGQTFSEAEVGLTRALTHQLAGAVQNARALLALRAAGTTGEGRAGAIASLVKGEVASRGLAKGMACVFRRRASLLGEDAHEMSASVDLETALHRTARELADLQDRVATRLPEAASLIFEAHLLMLADSGFRGRMLELAQQSGDPVAAVAAVARKYIDMFEKNSHAYMREKAKDVEDLALRILGALRGGAGEEHSLHERHVVIARELFPSDILTLAAEGVSGVVLTDGGTTSHVAILCRSMQIPTVIVHCPELLEVPDETPVIVDAESGNVYVRPSDLVVDEFDRRISTQAVVAERAADVREETDTADGVRVGLMANINLLSELDLALNLKAEGVGLYRTEFPFLVRDTFPTVDEQEKIYRELFKRMKGREITIRTLDAGGDKMLAYFDSGEEANPGLGLRSTRLALRHPEILDDQLTAILRAREPGDDVRIMFPMIASPDEFAAAKDRFVKCWGLLPSRARGELPEVGMMLELPAVVDLMDVFVELADFFSVGTNDFVQYMLAADRTNEEVSEYYCPHHPSVLRALSRMIEPVLAGGRDLSVCGEMAHDPRYLRFLVGIGVRKLSVEPSTIPDIQRLLSSETCDSMEAYAKQLLACTSIRDVEEAMTRVLGDTGCDA